MRGLRRDRWSVYAGIAPEGGALRRFGGELTRPAAYDGLALTPVATRDLPLVSIRSARSQLNRQSQKVVFA
jgi:hypothetical protein